MGFLPEVISNPKSEKARCPICNTRLFQFEVKEKKRSIPYKLCSACGFVCLSKTCHLSAEAKKARYLLHHNDDETSGYHQYLESFIEKAILPFADPSYPVLDFGSGPSKFPTLPRMLRSKGFCCDLYDPVFARTRRWRTKKYGLIILHEVVEHIENPRRTLAMLYERLAPNGLLAIRTRFLPDDLKKFVDWWYRMDPTHISFFQRDGLVTLVQDLGFDRILFECEDIIVAGFRFPSYNERDSMK